MEFLFDIPKSSYLNKRLKPWCLSEETLNHNCDTSLKSSTKVAGVGKPQTSNISSNQIGKLIFFCCRIARKAPNGKLCYEIWNFSLWILYLLFTLTTEIWPLQGSDCKCSITGGRYCNSCVHSGCDVYFAGCFQCNISHTFYNMLQRMSIHTMWNLQACEHMSNHTIYQQWHQLSCSLNITYNLVDICASMRIWSN